MKFHPIVFLLTLSLLFTACKTYSEDNKKQFDQKIARFVKKSGQPYKKSESGLYYIIEKEGGGRHIKFTDEVSFTYTGKLLNGTVFDQQFKNKPATFKVSALIEGWKEAMLYLKKGGKAKLIVPPQLGYGDHELDAIPKNSILYFEIEVLEVN